MSTRQAFAKTLSRLPEGENTVNITSVALALGRDVSIISRYLREFRHAGYVTSRKGVFAGALLIQIIDREGLGRLANGGERRSGGAVAAGEAQR